MIPPAELYAREWNVVQGMVQVGRPDAYGIERQSDRGCPAQKRNEQARRSGKFGKASEKHDLFRPGYPGRRDCNETGGRAKVRKPCDGIGKRQRPARDRPPS